MERVSDSRCQSALYVIGGIHLNIEEYITTLTEQIRFKQARWGVAQEIRNHISDQTQAYEQSGIEHEKAVEMAVREMGDPVEAGVALDRIHRPQFDWRLFLMTVLFSFAGVFLMYVTGAISDGPGQLTRQCFFTVLGIGVVLLIYFADYTLIGKYALPIYILMSVAFLVYNMTGVRINGCIPALRSLVYLYLPVYAGILYRYRKKGFSGIIKSLLFMMLTAFLAQRLALSMYVSFSVGLICTVLLLYAVMKGWFGVNQKRTVAMIIVSVFAAALTIFVVYVLFFSHSYQRIRMLAFFHPDSHQNDINFQLTLARRALANAQIIGGNAEVVLEKGLVYNSSFLIFAQSVAMYGMIVGAAVIAAFALFAYRALKIVKHQKNQLGMMISAACFLFIFFNCITGVMMNFGLFPMSTLQFPFLTRSGNGTIMYAVMIGLLMSCRRCGREQLS